MLAKVLFLFDLTKKKKKKRTVEEMRSSVWYHPTYVLLLRRSFFFFFQLVLKGLFTQKMQSLVSWLKKKMEPAYPGPSDVSEG